MLWPFCMASTAKAPSCNVLCHLMRHACLVALGPPIALRLKVVPLFRGVIVDAVSELEIALHAHAGADEKQHMKNSFKSCEVLCCEVNEMYSVLMHEEDLLEKLFSSLDSPKPLNLTRAGYFARVVSCLLMKRASEVLAFLDSRRGIVDKLLQHLDTTSTAEVQFSCSSHPLLFVAVDCWHQATLMYVSRLHYSLSCNCA